MFLGYCRNAHLDIKMNGLHGIIVLCLFKWILLGTVKETDGMDWIKRGNALCKPEPFRNILYCSKVWGRIFCLFWEINTFIKRGCIKLIKSNFIDIHIVTKHLLKKCCSFYSLNHLVSSQILRSTTVLNIKKYLLPANQHIKKISEGSWSWGNDLCSFSFAITEITF